ncbi:MAG: DUF1287 domain-containing protein [Mariprofundaceae bacterium]|nr:DUF1287 domain-containing protein [Mariprofundaceae bacterium]
MTNEFLYGGFSVLFDRKLLKSVAVPFLLFLSVLGVPSLGCAEGNFYHRLADAAIERTTHKITYDGAYVGLKYPNGDVAPNIGVCTDVIIRSYRKVGADLQSLIHKDMVKHFSLYPSKRIWGLTKTDKNIDHRRVPNQRVFFERYGKSLPVTTHADDYKAGDIVSWRLNSGRAHIGIVTYLKSPKTGNPLVVHNVGDGPQIEDALFVYKITGHYRYNPNDTHALKNMRVSNQAPSHKKIKIAKKVLSKIVEIQ